MNLSKLELLLELLTEFRNDSVDREEFDRRDEFMMEVSYYIEAEKYPIGGNNG